MIAKKEKEIVVKYCKHFWNHKDIWLTSNQFKLTPLIQGWRFFFEVWLCIYHSNIGSGQYKILQKTESLFVKDDISALVPRGCLEQNALPPLNTQKVTSCTPYLTDSMMHHWIHIFKPVQWKYVRCTFFTK